MRSKVSSLKHTPLAQFLAPALIAGLALGLVLAMATEVSADPPTSWYVDPTSGSDATGCGTVITPCLTIGCAIGEADNGASIILNPGIYTQTATLEITKSITLTARDGLGSAAVAGDGIERVILIESDGVTLSELEVRNGTGDVIRQSDSYTRTVITGTTVHDCGDECIQLKKCTNCLIENVTVYDAAQDGLSIADGSRNSTIRSCEVYSTGSENAAIYIYYSYSMTVESTYLHDNQAANGIGFYKNYGGTHTIANNLIVHNRWRSGEQHCYDEADGNAIWIYKPQVPSTYTVRHNTLDDNRPANDCAKPGNAIYVKKSADGVVVNVDDNIATNHEGYGIRTWNGASVTYSYNDFWQNDRGATYGDTVNPVDGGGNISADPLYNTDYTLPDESPAANAASDGKDMGYLTVEHESAPLPIGGATIPLGKIELLAPWMVLTAALMGLIALVAYIPGVCIDNAGGSPFNRPTIKGE